MLELYQFELSQYSEKVRLILDYKGLEYKKIEVTPGIGQLELFRLSGQRQVPVLKDGETFVADSTEIAFYLDRKYPEKPIIPTEPLLRGQCLLIEEWADESIGLKGRKAFIGALNQNQNFRISILPKNVPDFFKSLVGAVPSEFLGLLGTGVGFGPDAIKEARRGLEQDLEALTLILQNRPYLVGDEPTLADLAVAGLSMILKFPAGNYLNVPEQLKGKGIPGLADRSAYEPFFSWRDRLYAQYRKPLTGSGETDSSPTSIEID
ncbi:glutathione S-transferase [Hydrococcus rivularis NIES-593]|uniref:Glutathione S-transferase n=1 Tax=Hydrococcus rivularis NIES-593 TaxID=1921803 RepID=A0A1U7HPW5_9CYAN|nr:glutathione S-transferase family protein [Hydrococcus rivularis]OKH25565.1 glutathione S-transferase [Hydrococcus rivularis NIES-593]